MRLYERLASLRKNRSGGDGSGDAFVAELYGAASLSGEQKAVGLARVLDFEAR